MTLLRRAGEKEETMSESVDFVLLWDFKKVYLNCTSHTQKSFLSKVVFSSLCFLLGSHLSLTFFSLYGNMACILRYSRKIV